MSGSHAERADELAAQAHQALQELLEQTQARAEGKQMSAFARAAQPGTTRSDVLWMRLQALQNQAQIHATLALNDTLAARGL
ncbi:MULTISPECIES: hypothetical protein [unclassified Nocardia]|uniref:hypothetical protein n=1 Tax=unclassified Nocardia TaxID=2637762 RepID=UPI00278C3539|nr:MULTISPECIES: hypothetical protein [unclassified Nocardia]